MSATLAPADVSASTAEPSGAASAGPALALLFWEGHLVVSPGLLSAVRALAAAGYSVDIYMRGGDAGMPPLAGLPPRVRVWKCEISGKLRKRYPDQEQASRFSGALSAAVYAGWLVRALRKPRFDAIVGVDAVGGACAWIVAKLRRVPLFVWSLELSFRSESRNPLRRLLKTLERAAFRDARAIIVQDELRAQTLLQENAVPHSRLILLPNSPAGPGRLRQSEYLHRCLDLDPATPLVLHAGMLDRTVLAFEVAQSVASWPKPYHLVFNVTFHRTAGEPYIRRILDLRNPRVHVKLAPAPEAELDEMVASARFGLAIYDVEHGPNYTLIVKASGKIPTYLRNGVPVICQDHPGMRAMIESYGCGVVVSSIDEIARAIETIERDYDGYRARALECYAREYESSRHLPKLLDALAAEIQTPASPVDGGRATKGSSPRL